MCTSAKRKKTSGQRLPKHLTQYACLFDLPETTKLNFKTENKKDRSLIKILICFQSYFWAQFSLTGGGEDLHKRVRSKQVGKEITY